MRYDAQVYSYTLLAKATGISTYLCVPKAVFKLWQNSSLENMQQLILFISWIFIEKCKICKMQVTANDSDNLKFVIAHGNIALKGSKIPCH
jgi:hypothetical protein